MKVEAINRRMKIAVTDTDELCDFDTMFDIEGDETNDPDECVVAIVRLPNGLFEVIKLGDFELLGSIQ